MPYLDPFDYFKIGHPDDVNADLLRKLRRRVMADFELSDDGRLEWAGQQLDRTTVQQLLDALEDPITVQRYWQVHEMPEFADWLTGGTPPAITKFPKQRIMADAGLRKLCSHLLAPVYSEQLGHSLESHRWANVIALQKHAGLFLEEDLDVAWAQAMRFAQSRLIAIEAILAEDAAALASFAYREHAESAWINVFNRFPIQFEHVRNRYSLALQRLATKFFQRGDLRDAARAVITAASQLQQDESLRMDCNRLKLAICKKTADLEEERENVGKGCTIAIGLVMMVLVVAIALIKTGSHRPAYVPLPDILSSPDYDPGGRHRPSSHHPAADEPILYRLLSFQLAIKDRPDCKSARPATGWSPYKDIFSEPYGEQPQKKAEFNLHNQSNRDMVLLIEGGEPNEIVASYYVRANAKLKTQSLPEGNYRFRVLNGQSWCDSIGDYGGKALGAFTVDQVFIGTYVQGESSLRAPVLEHILEGKGKDRFEIQFDGTDLHWTRK